jgi:pilus assembly protein Flp/PilA
MTRMLGWSSSPGRLAAASRRFAADNSGATAIEYGLLLALILLAILAAVSQVSDGLNAVFGRLSADFNG